jgi:hypothetical protein
VRRGLTSLVIVVTAVGLLWAAAYADGSSAAAGLSIARILGGPNHGDAVQFTMPGGGTQSIHKTYAGQRLSMTLAPQERAPVLFANFTTQPGVPAQAPTASIGDQELGLSFNLLGAQSSVSFVNSASNWNSGASSASPAVFAFYNVPNALAPSSQQNLFGFGGPAAALAGQATVFGDASDTAATSLLSFPLVSSLSAQGPFWYGGYTPALSGSSVQFNIPVRVARVGLRFRVGEQSLSAEQSTSLANQILGPAFASASNYNAFNGGVTLALPLLNRRATVSLDGLYQSLQQGNAQSISGAPPAAGPAGLAPSSGPIVLYPAAESLQQYVGAASLALPVTSRLTVKGSVSEQLGGTVDLNALTQSLTQHTTAYVGGLVYNLPKGNSSIDFIFNRNVYSDDATASSWATNRQNLYFSVKF